MKWFCVLWLFRIHIGNNKETILTITCKIKKCLRTAQNIASSPVRTQWCRFKLIGRPYHHNMVFLRCQSLYLITNIAHKFIQWLPVWVLDVFPAHLFLNIGCSTYRSSLDVPHICIIKIKFKRYLQLCSFTENDIIIYMHTFTKARYSQWTTGLRPLIPPAQIPGSCVFVQMLPLSFTLSLN